MYKIDSNFTASPTWMFPHASVSNKKEKLKLQTLLSYFAISVIKTNQLFEHFIFFCTLFRVRSLYHLGSVLNLCGLRLQEDDQSYDKNTTTIM